MLFQKCMTSTFFTSKETHYFTILLNVSNISYLRMLNMKFIMEQLVKLYESVFNSIPYAVQLIDGTQPNGQKYFRLSDGEKSCIGVIGGDALDNRLLVEAAKYLKSKSVNIQTVYASTIDFKAFLLEDDGDDALHDMHAIIGKTDDGITHVQEMLRYSNPNLSIVQFEESSCNDGVPYNKTTILFDLNEFKYCFLKTSKVIFHENDLQDEFESFADDLTRIDTEKLVYAGLSSRQVYNYALLKVLKTLGFLGLRGITETDSYSLAKIPKAIECLKSLIPTMSGKYPHLSEVLCRLVDGFKFNENRNDGKLIVTVTSFSFWLGVPNDFTGNGSGYVFDCRGINNPGRIEPYKHLSGRDADVVKILDEDTGVKSFLEHIIPLVDSHTESYIKRNFTNLMVSFGGTGGKHRSVYCAEKCARHLSQKYPDITVRIVHRELKIEEYLSPADKGLTYDNQ